MDDKYLPDDNDRWLMNFPEWYKPENEGHNIMACIGSVMEALDRENFLEEHKIKAVERYCFGCYGFK